MNKVLVCNYNDISYSGRLIYGGLDSDCIVIKPSLKSECCIGFKTNSVKCIINENGMMINNNLEFQNFADTISDESIIVRTKGSASFRGKIDEPLIKKIEMDNSLWIYPTESKNIFFIVPNDEIIEKFKCMEKEL